MTTDNKHKKKETPNYSDKRTFLYLGGSLKERLFNYFNSDPRFKSMSECAVHLINLGLKHDKKDREKVLKDVE